MCVCAQIGDDKLYVLDTSQKMYVPVDAAVAARIASGEMRL
jgi:hypothetical protein